MNVKLIYNSPDIERIISYCTNFNASKNSSLDMASIGMEISTSKAVAHNILSHKNFRIQEHNLEIPQFDLSEAEGSEDDKDWFDEAQRRVIVLARELYAQGIHKGISKDQMNTILPLVTETKLNMHGTVRDWVRFVNSKTLNDEQKEIIKKTLKNVIPTIAFSLGW